MKIVDYKPKNEGFSGELKIKIPTYKERLKMAKTLSLQKLADKDSDQFGILEGLIDAVKDHIAVIDLKFGEEVFKSPDELDYFEEGTQLLTEIGHMLINGISLGKN